MDARALGFLRCPFQKIAQTAAQYAPAAAAASSAAASGLSEHTRALLSGAGPAASKAAPFYATEKVHGAQLQLYVRLATQAEVRDALRGATSDEVLASIGGGASVARHGTVMMAAKRTAFLSSTESFFGFQEAVEASAAGVSAIARELLLACPPTAGAPFAIRDAMPQLPQERGGFAVLYCELFGGWYPPQPLSYRPATKPSASGLSGGAAVQEGVYYSPRPELCVFDVAVAGGGPALIAALERASQGDEEVTVAPHRLPLSETIRLCKTHAVLGAPVRAQGVEGEVHDTTAVFDSEVPAALTALRPVAPIPPLPPGTNLAEGVVVRPNSAALCVTYKKGPAVPMFKKKHPAFHEVEALGDRAPPTEAPTLQLRRFLRRHATVNRVAAVVSKHGAPPAAPASTEEWRAATEAAVVEDVWEDFWADPEAATLFAHLHSDEAAALETDVAAAAKDAVAGYCRIRAGQAA